MANQKKQFEIQDQKLIEALDNISNEITEFPLEISGTKIESDKASLCKKYRTIRPWLETILTFVEKIPVIGKKLADAIRFLMIIADMVC